ncbi:MAG: biotin/lipoyl-binding protein [Gammaproteobacteria bacterium]|nr:biotin/lipoyl-binding protein [Gammaproteobacteria bacterium]
MVTIKKIPVPDIGDFENVEIIEILVSPGDAVEAEASLLVLESDKAAMEIPAPQSGVIHEIMVKTGDRVCKGDLIMSMEVTNAARKKPDVAPPPSKAAESEAERPRPEIKRSPPKLVRIDDSAVVKAHASPAVRRFSRELGVDLSKVQGSGRKERIRKQDVQAFVKEKLQKPPAAAPGFNLPEMPMIDFSQFGEIETRPLSRIQKISGANLHRNWVSVPHVTHFDEADITELEAFRKSLAEEAGERGVKITIPVFLIKASAAALKIFPNVNSALSPDGLILKKYFHIGIAVDTPAGLVVPVIRDADRKGLFDIAAELALLIAKAQEQKLVPADMQGGCFTITSLGGIGGTAFTPIVNAPEVAILGVSRAQVRPVYRKPENEAEGMEQGTFVPRLLLPLSLSYDHRVVDGVQAARFCNYFSLILSDVRRLLL